jgi:hypothetical protein
MNIETLPKTRWQAVATYRQAGGPDFVRRWQFDEITDLHDAIERGPNFCAIKHIVITYAKGDEFHVDLTQDDMDSPFPSADVIEFPRSEK